MKKIVTTLFCALCVFFSFAQRKHTVSVADNIFTPANLTVNVGDTVVWTNTGGTHNVNGTQATFASNPASFTSGAASSSNWTFTHIFTTAGLYNYRCDVHFASGMVGTVTVKNAAMLLTGIVDGPLSGGTPKSLELFVYEDIPDLSVYKLQAFTNGSTTGGTAFTFPTGAVTAGTYIHVSSEAPNFAAYFGFAATYTSSVANLNGDDAVRLSFNGSVVDVFGEVGVDGSGTPWDSVDGWVYRKSGTGADGNTFVIGNWNFSGIDALDNTTTNATATNPFPIKTYTRTASANPVVSFAAGSATVAESGTSVTVEVNITAANANATSVTVTQTGGTATNGSDYTFNTLTATFPANSTTNQTLTIPITEDATGEGDETIVLTLSNPTNNATLGSVSTMTITITDNDYIVTTISNATADNNNDTRPDMLGSKAEITGVVYGTNLNPNGLSFTAIDKTDIDGGINVFNNNKNFTYTVTEGDLVKIRGTVGLFNGLSQITVDTLWKESSGNALHPATVITALAENTESKLVRFSKVWLTDVAQWPATGANASVTVTDGTNNIVIRIDADTDIDGSTAPLASDTLQITGIGSQFDSSLPHDTGYQLNPRYLSDIVVVARPVTPVVGFATATANINEAAGSVTVTLNITNANTNATSVTVALDASSTASTGTDFTFTSPQTITFPANSTTAQTFNITINDDATVESAETIVLKLSNATNSATIATATHTITISDNDVNEYNINTITADADNNFIADSTGVACTVRGIVYGVNQRSSGLSFTIINKTNADAGIGVFSNTNNFGYTVTEGDEVIVQGTVGQFNGLTQLTATNVSRVSQANALHAAAAVTALNETTESKLVKISNLRLVTPSQWPAANASANVDMTNGTTTFVVRVTQFTDIDGTTAPTTDDIFEVTGLGGQFDSSTDPKDAGYQLMPRYLTDVKRTGGVPTHDPKFSEQIKFGPNPTRDALRINSSINIEKVEVFDILGKQMTMLKKPSRSFELNVTELPQGVYFIKFMADERYWTATFVKQ